MRITFHGHACFSVFCNDIEFLIDPFLTGNPQCEVELDDVCPDVILVTHGHEDHWETRWRSPNEPARPWRAR